MLLDVALDQQRRRLPAEMPGGRGRHGARVDREEVAPGRQHVRTAAGRRAARSGLDEPAIERAQHGCDFRGTAVNERRAQAMLDLLEHRTGRAPRGCGGAAASDEVARQQLQPLDRIASRTPGFSVTDCNTGGFWPVHGSAIGQSSGSKPARSRSAASARSSEASPPSPDPRGTLTRATSRSMSWSPTGAWPNTCRPSRICSSFSSHRWLSSLPKAASGVVPGTDPDVPIEAEPSAQRQDLAAQVRHAPRIQPCCLIVLVDQALELGQWPIGLGAGQGRRQMIDDHRGRAPLRLRAFARIVDDERVDVGQGPEHGLRQAVGRERERLARQPFQIAVLAHVDDRVRAEFPAQPAIEREIAVRRRQVRVVIAGARVDVIAARRLDPDHDVAERQQRERERAATDMRIGVRRPPALDDAFSGHRQRVGQRTRGSR